MKKKTIITALLALATLSVQAQELRMNEPSFSDYLPLLKAKGYIAYSFDTRDFTGKYVEPVVKEYVDGKETNDLLGEGIAFAVGEKVIIGLAPSDNDSTQVYTFNFTGSGGFNSLLELRPMRDTEDSTRIVYLYEPRPFELIPPFTPGHFIPLVLYGSYWYDKDSDVNRFCGEKFIKPALSSDIVKYIPHFYILGIRIRE